MDIAIIVCVVLCELAGCLLLMAGFMLWDQLTYGSFAPDEEVLWPVDHPNYQPHRRTNRDRIR